jgi:hypothetical protein
MGEIRRFAAEINVDQRLILIVHSTKEKSSSPVKIIYRPAQVSPASYSATGMH